MTKSEKKVLEAIESGKSSLDAIVSASGYALSTVKKAVNKLVKADLVIERDGAYFPKKQVEEKKEKGDEKSGESGSEKASAESKSGEGNEESSDQGIDAAVALKGFPRKAKLLARAIFQRFGYTVVSASEDLIVVNRTDLSLEQLEADVVAIVSGNLGHNFDVKYSGENDGSLSRVIGPEASNPKDIVIGRVLPVFGVHHKIIEVVEKLHTTATGGTKIEVVVESKEGPKYRILLDYIKRRGVVGIYNGMLKKPF